MDTVEKFHVFTVEILRNSQHVSLKKYILKTTVDCLVIINSLDINCQAHLAKVGAYNTLEDMESRFYISYRSNRVTIVKVHSKWHWQSLLPDN